VNIPFFWQHHWQPNDPWQLFSCQWTALCNLKLPQKSTAVTKSLWIPTWIIVVYNHYGASDIHSLIQWQANGQDFGFRGNVRNSSIARWKSCGRLPIRYNWTFFASSYGWDVISRYWSKSEFFKEGWVTLSKNFRWKGSSPTNLFLYQKTRLITLSCDVKISAVCFVILSQSTHLTDGWTDGQTDKQNYDHQDRASIAASRGKNPKYISQPIVNGLTVAIGVSIEIIVITYIEKTESMRHQYLYSFQDITTTGKKW